MLQTFQRLNKGQLQNIEKILEQQDIEEEEDRDEILCRLCLHGITSHSRKIEKRSHHTHSFTNPGGITFQIGCFHAAGGCANQGIPTIEFTWFPDYAWVYSHCAGCLTHLGWFYRSKTDSFYGLILSNLIEE